MAKKLNFGISRQSGMGRVAILLIVAAVTLLSSQLAQGASPDAKVKIDSGKLSGAADANGVMSYLGIPFAKPPVGDLRWRPPQPVVPWTGVRDATKFGANCVQGQIHGDILPYTKEFFAQGDVSEDCLFVNVWTDGTSKSKKRPVMVFIYGGSFGAGSGSLVIYDGAHLAKKGVVVVTLNYRVGLLGFLAHPELSNESEHHVSGNYGILDQIAALEWVKRNIQAFGGNPANVTIFGQSAGALSVSYLMRSPLAQGLFVRGIAESGFGVLPMSMFGPKSLQATEAAGVKFAESHGAHSLAELRALPTSAVLRAGGIVGPTIDGYVLPVEPPAHQVPLLVGMNSGDGAGASMFGTHPPDTVAAYQETAHEKYGAAAEDFLKLYPVTQDSEVGAMKQTEKADEGRIKLDLWCADQYAKSQTVYLYYFDRPIPWPAHPEFGAFHTAEIPYIFQNFQVLDRPWEKIDYQLADTMSSYWSNFAKTGNPNGKGLPEWPLYAPDKHEMMELGVHVGAIPVADGARLQFQLSNPK